ncbi:Predicted amidohydrolase [Mucilaginibacter pineti]|uniref:Predicted amidohydrolase n=2 Tax=Mucilaginibacter pineti TaxID=1391627 RepID=A0A1G7B1X6_9SPHI|nr:Predicted amidohydrolase [Mucilaginibacter pineti]
MFFNNTLSSFLVTLNLNLVYMKIALASPPYPRSITDGLLWVEKLAKEAAEQQAEIICFPETYLPGYPGMGASPADSAPEKMQRTLNNVCKIAAENGIAIIIPMDWYHNGVFLNVVQVVSNKGDLLGYQTKNQLDPTEDEIWTAGTTRRIFEVNGLKFGITICHEGFRYPESVRWAAMNGAHIVFHPYCTGSDVEGSQLTEWGHKDNPYYEKAQMMRAIENTIYFASSNYAFKYPDAASALIAPDGNCIAWQPYGQPGVLVADVDPAKATGLLGKRFKAGLYY